MQPCGHSKNPIKQPSNDLSNYPIWELESIFSVVSASTKKESKRKKGRIYETEECLL